MPTLPPHPPSRSTANTLAPRPPLPTRGPGRAWPPRPPFPPEAPSQLAPPVLWVIDKYGGITRAATEADSRAALLQMAPVDGAAEALSTAKALTTATMWGRPDAGAASLLLNLAQKHVDVADYLRYSAPGTMTIKPLIAIVRRLASSHPVLHSPGTYHATIHLSFSSVTPPYAFETFYLRKGLLGHLVGTGADARDKATIRSLLVIQRPSTAPTIKAGHVSFELWANNVSALGFPGPQAWATAQQAALTEALASISNKWGYAYGGLVVCTGAAVGAPPSAEPAAEPGPPAAEAPRGRVAHSGSQNTCPHTQRTPNRQKQQHHLSSTPAISLS